MDIRKTEEIRRQVNVWRQEKDEKNEKIKEKLNKVKKTQQIENLLCWFIFNWFLELIFLTSSFSEAFFSFDSIKGFIFSGWKPIFSSWILFSMFFNSKKYNFYNIIY